MDVFRKGPRDFAGNKSAPLRTFFDAYLLSLSDDDNIDPTSQDSVVCAEIIKLMRARVVTDLGGFMKVPLDKVNAMLGKIQGRLRLEEDLLYYADSWQDLLDFEFPPPPPITSSAVVHDPAVPPSSHKLVKIEKKSSFLLPAQVSLGAFLTANGTIGNYILERHHFPLIKTANPEIATITKPELAHAIDVGYWYTFKKFGVVNVDLTWRTHLGGQIRDLFPNFPDRGQRGTPGFIAGKDRDPAYMLKWRFQNPRKSMSIREGYKSKQTIARSDMCAAALELEDKVGTACMPFTITGDDDTVVRVKHFPFSTVDSASRPAALMGPSETEPAPQLAQPSAPDPVTQGGVQMLTLGAAAMEAAIAGAPRAPLAPLTLGAARAQMVAARAPAPVAQREESAGVGSGGAAAAVQARVAGAPTGTTAGSAMNASPTPLNQPPAASGDAPVAQRKESGAAPTKYIVAKIHSHKKVGSGFRLLVEWEGYPNELTWEPRGNLKKNSIFLAYEAEHMQGAHLEPARATPPCGAATGCLCPRPGELCGFRWQTPSAYEQSRANSLRENQQALHALGLVDAAPEQPAVPAALSADVAVASAASVAPSCDATAELLAATRKRRAQEQVDRKRMVERVRADVTKEMNIQGLGLRINHSLARALGVDVPKAAAAPLVDNPEQPAAPVPADVRATAALSADVSGEGAPSVAAFANAQGAAQALTAATEPSGVRTTAPVAQCVADLPMVAAVPLIGSVAVADAICVDMDDAPSLPSLQKGGTANALTVEQVAERMGLTVERVAGNVLTRSQVDEIAQLVYTNMHDLSTEKMLRDTAAIIGDSETNVIVLRKGRTIVAAAAYTLNDVAADNELRAYLFEVQITEGLRSAGLGKALVADAEDAAFCAGRRSLVLSVAELSPYVGFYEQGCGFDRANQRFEKKDSGAVVCILEYTIVAKAPPVHRAKSAPMGNAPHALSPAGPQSWQVSDDDNDQLSADDDDHVLPLDAVLGSHNGANAEANTNADAMAGRSQEDSRKRNSEDMSSSYHAELYRTDGPCHANLRIHPEHDSDFTGEWLDNGDLVYVVEDSQGDGGKFAKVVGPKQQSGYVRSVYLIKETSRAKRRRTSML